MSVPRGDALALARALVRIDSRNPSLVPGAPGEGAVATALATILREWGMHVEINEAAPGRPNVIARAGPARAPRLMMNGHLDVVGVEGMTHPPFDAELRDGRLYGRGAADMKSGIAAMCAAAARAVDAGLDGEIVLTAVSDEEYESAGMRALLASGVRADAAIVAEPTALGVALAHRGFVWIDVTVHGRAAHGSRYEIGVDAIRGAALVLAELDGLEQDVLPRHTHPLLGRASIHASLIAGGTGMSTYPDRCDLALERRTLPGETGADALHEVRAACDRVEARSPQLRIDAALRTAQSPSEVSANAPIALGLRQAVIGTGLPERLMGMSAWTDAALLNDAGIPAICFGPGDIALAHAAEEWAPVDEIELATAALTRLATQWCGGHSWRS